MATPTLILGANNWAIEEDNILGYALGSSSKQYLPREISFTRGSDATYTDSTGIIRRSPWNLCLQSENFTSTWLMFAGPAVTPNAGTAPNGTQTATILNSAGGGNDFLYQNINTTVGATYTQTLYVKNINSSNSKIWTAISATPVVEIYWSGATITSVVGVGVTSSYTSVGDGWYRVILTYVATTTTLIFRIYSDSLNTSKSIYIWGAQLVEGSDPLPYLRTTDRLNMPRVDSSTGTKAFLVEPQRTNLALYSNDFTNVVWSKSGATVTPNTTISPDGTQNASTVVFSGVDKYVTQGCFTLGTSATSSVWVKGTSGETITIACGGTDQVFTLNGSWQRLSVSRASTSNIYANINTFLGATARTIYVYGFQAEVGAYPTSYIPTQATTVTRIADRSIMSSVSGLIGQSEGTIFAEVEYVRDSTFTPRKPISINSGSSANLVDIYVNAGDNTLTARVRANSVGYGTISITNNPTGRIKIAYAYKANDYVLYINGSSYGAITTGGPFVFSSPLSIFQAGCGESSNDELGGRIFQSAVYTTRLANAELAALTTL